MDKTGALYFEGGIDVKKLYSTIDQINARIGRMADSTEKHGAKMDSVFSNLTTTAGAFLSLNFAGQIGRQLIQVTGQFEQLGVALETILGSKAKADALMSQVIETASTTPFELTDVATGTKQLLAYGFAAEDIIGNIRMLGDVASGVSAPIGDLVYLYGTLRTQGRAYTRDIMQFTARGIPIIRELANVFGITEAEVSKLVESGKVGFPEVEKAFHNLTKEGGMFFNLMAKQSETITGQLSNLQDNIDTMLNSLGSANSGLIKDGIAGLNTLVANYEDVLNILKLLVVTYGSYKAAVMLAAVAQKAMVAAGNIQAWFELAKGIKTAKDAQMAFNLVSKANPYGLILAGIGAIISALIIFRDKTDVATGVTADFNQNLSETTKEIKSNFKAITDAESGSKKHAEAIQAVNDKYKDYLPNLLSEKSSLEDIKQAQDAVVESMAKSLAFKAQGEQLSDAKSVVEKQLNNFYDQIEDASSRLDEKQRGKFVAMMEDYKKTLGEEFEQLGYFPEFTMNRIGEIFKSISGEMLGGWDLGDLDYSIKDLIGSESELEGKTESLKTTYESYLEALGLTGNSTNESVEGQKTIQKQIEETTKAIAEGQKKLSELRAEGSVATVKDIEDQEKAVAELKKQLETLTGIKRKEIDKQIKSEEDRDKELQDQARKEIDLQFQASQSKINAMKDGSQKELAQMKLNHEKEKEALRRQREDLIKVNVEVAEALFRSNPANKGKAFDSSTVGLTTNQKSLFGDVEAGILAKQNQEEADFYDKKLKIYQSYAESRKALAEKYESDRDLAIKSGGSQEVFAEIDRQEKEALKALNVEFALKSEDYKSWLDSIVSMSLQMLESELSSAHMALFEATKLGQDETQDTAQLRAKIAQLEARIKGLIKQRKDNESNPKKSIGEWRDLQEALGEVGDELTAIGDSVDGIAGKSINAALELTTFAFSTIESIELITTGTLSAIEKASVVLTIISTAIRLLRELDSILPTAYDKYLKYDEKIEEINRMTDAVNQYKVAVLEASQAETSWFSTDNLKDLRDYKAIQQEVMQAYLDKLYEAQAVYQNEKGGGWATSIYRGIADFYDNIWGTNLSGNNYKEGTTAAINNLRIETRKKSSGFLGSGWGAKSQQTEDLVSWVKKNLGIDLFDDRGLIDSEAARVVLEEYGEKLVGQTKETLEELIELREQYDEYIVQLREYVSSLYEPLVTNMVDSIWDWLDEGKDALDSFKSYASDTFRDIVSDMMRTIILENVVGSFSDDIADLYEQYSLGTMSMDDLMQKVANETSELMGNYEDQIPALQEMLTAISETLNGVGIDLSSTTSNATSGMVGQVARSITEDTASELVGLWNRTSLDTRGILVSAQSMVGHLVMIEANTLRTADNTDKLKVLDDIKAGIDKLNSSGSRI